MKNGLGWIQWSRGLWCVISDLLFQRIAACNLENPMPLPPIHGITSIVTGSTSGIGLQVARNLAEAGAHVVMAVRNVELANEIVQKWQIDWSKTGLPLNIEVMKLDLLSLESIVRFANAWNACSRPLNVLINNAGIYSIGEPQKFSKHGYEEHMQVNHLSPALLSILLLPSLIRGSPSRIINVNSVMHHLGFVDPEDMNVVSGKRKYTSCVGYSGSKLAQLMFSNVLHKRLPSESGINVICVSPGSVYTNVVRNLSKLVQASYRLLPYLIFSPQEGSRSSLFAATDPEVPEYCELLRRDGWPICAFIGQDCRPSNPSEEACDFKKSVRIWDKTLQMVGLPPDVVELMIEGKTVECSYRPSDYKK